MAATMFSLFLCFMAIWAVDYAHCASHQAPAPSVDCSSLILNMADCLSFVSNGSTVSKPEGTCCNGLRTVLKADAACLCESFKSSAQLGVVLNITKAMTLPAACKVSAPSATNCAVSITPASAPGLPSGSTPSPSSSPTVAPGGEDNEQAPAPSPLPGGSGSSVLSISVGSLLVGLLVTSFSNF